MSFGGGMPMGGLPPQMMQMLMAQLAQQKQLGGPQPPPMPPMPSGGQGQMQPPQPGQGQGQMPQFQPGASTMMLPGGTASPAITGIPMSATPPGEKPRLTGTGIMGSVLAIKNNFEDKKVQKARALASQQIAMLQNPEMKKAMEDAAKKDPGVAKALEKQQKEWIKIYDKAMTDPTSAEYNGVQMAYRDLTQQEQQDTQMREIQAKMQEQQAMASQRSALAEQERAKAADLKRQTELRGTVTEEDQFKRDAKMEQVTAQIKARMLQTQTSTRAMLEAVNARVAGSIKIAGMKEQGAKARQATKIDTYIQGEYRALQGQLNELDRQSKDLTLHLDKTTHWYGDAEDKADVQQKLSQIEAQRGILMKQFQGLQEKDKAFQGSGLTAKPLTGSGTLQDPIVIP